MVCDKYVAGPDGFVIAQWCHDSSSLQLEVPNCLLKEGQLISAKFNTKEDPQEKKVTEKKRNACSGQQ